MSNVKKNYIYQVCYQILISILPFITSPYIARVLGAKMIGVYSYTYSIVVYFKIFASLGIINYGNRAIAKSKGDQQELNKTFSSLLILHILLTSAIIMLYLLYVHIFVCENKLIAYIQTFYLLAELVDISWFYFGLEKFKITVIRNSILKIATVISVFIFVHDNSDLWKYVFILAFGTFLSLLSVWPFVPKFVSLVRVPVKRITSHIKPMIILFFAVVAVSVYSYMDKVMIGKFSNMSELGYYENAWKMTEFPVNFVTAIGTVMMPKISNLIVKGDFKTVDKYIYGSIRFSVIASVAIAFGVAGIAKEFAVVFWGNQFMESGNIMIILSITIILIAWNSVIRLEYLIPMEYDKVYLLGVCLAAIVNVLFNWFLIPRYGAFGAGIGTVISYFTIFIVQNLFCIKKLSILKYILLNIPYLIIGFVMFIFVRSVGNYFGCTVISLIMEVIVGVAVYSALVCIYAFAFKDKYVTDNIKFVLCKLKIKCASDKSL